MKASKPSKVKQENIMFEAQSDQMFFTLDDFSDSFVSHCLTFPLKRYWEYSYFNFMNLIPLSSHD